MIPPSSSLSRSMRRFSFTLKVKSPAFWAVLVGLVVSLAIPTWSQADDLYARAETLLAAGQHLEAASLYARFSAGLRPTQEPWKLAAMTARAWAYEQAGYRDSVVPLIVRLNALADEAPERRIWELASRLPGPVEEDLLLRKAALERAVGLPARPTLDRYRERFPQGKGIAAAYRDLAREAAGMAEWREFLRSCVRLGARDPRISKWRLELAEGELTLSDTRAAIRLWKTVVVRHTRTPEALEAVERLIMVTGRLPIGDALFVADLTELIATRRAEFAARGTLAAAEALLQRTRALMEGADPGMLSSPPTVSSSSSMPPASASVTPPVAVVATVATAPPVASVPATSPAPASVQTAPAPIAPAPIAPAPTASAPAVSATPPPQGSGLPAPTQPAPVRVQRLLTAPLPVRGGLEDYLKPLIFRLRGVAEERGLRIIPERWYYRYAAGAKDLADAVVGLDIARTDEGMVVTVSVIYPTANVTDVFTMPWKDRPLDEDYSVAARDILKLVLRD